MTAAMDPYILDDSIHIEYERLDLMSKILDPWTRSYLDAIGVGAGWRCLEIGGGNGSITEWLAGRVGSTGDVLSLDINTAILQLIPDQNVTVQQLDVRTGDLPTTGFDLVMCRALLHQIAADAPAVLAKMAAAVKPGGWLFVQEPDFHLAPTTEPQQWADVWKGILEWGQSQGVDWFIGRGLPAAVAGLGLGVPQATTDVQNIRGPRPWCAVLPALLRRGAGPGHRLGPSRRRRLRRRQRPPRRPDVVDAVLDDDVGVGPQAVWLIFSTRVPGWISASPPLPPTPASWAPPRCGPTRRYPAGSTSTTSTTGRRSAACTAGSRPPLPSGPREEVEPELAVRTLAVSFLRAGAVGPAVVDVDVVRRTRTFATSLITISQGQGARCSRPAPRRSPQRPATSGRHR